MRRFLRILALAAAVTGSAHAAGPANLTVLADASLMVPLAELARDYARDSGTPLTLAVKDSADVAGQIEQGLEAHLLLTANQPLLDTLKERGLVDVFHAKPFARAQLALVAPAGIAPRIDIARHISLAAMLYAQPDFPIYTTPDTTHEGNRAASLLTHKEYAELMGPRVVKLDSRADVIDKLHGGDGFGLLLATDAINDPALKVLYVFGADVSAPVDYEAVVLASESMPETRQFITYLLSRRGQHVFAHYGFQPPGV